MASVVHDGMIDGRRTVENPRHLHHPDARRALGEPAEPVADRADACSCRHRLVHSAYPTRPAVRFRETAPLGFYLFLVWAVAAYLLLVGSSSGGSITGWILGPNQPGLGLMKIDGGSRAKRHEPARRCADRRRRHAFTLALCLKPSRPGRSP